MKDIMKLEAIKHEAARQVFGETEYNWIDMLDNTADTDRTVATLVDEDQIKDFYLAFFRDMLTEMRWEDNK